MSWGSLYLRVSGAKCNLEESLNTNDHELIALRQNQFRRILDKYKRARLQYQQEKGFNNISSYMTKIYQVKLEEINQYSHILINRAIEKQKEIMFTNMGA